MDGVWDQLLVFAQIMLINLLLSGDNAIVIAMAGNRLPYAKRRQAVWWGSVAAIILRCVLTAGIVYLLRVPYLQTAGAVLLFFIALQLLLDHREQTSSTQIAPTMLGAIWTIVAADFVMSLDNVLAVAALTAGDPYMLILGIVLSFPIIIWGSSFIMRLLDRMPWLTYLGGALLGYTAAKMLLHDPGMRKVALLQSADVKRLLPLLTVVILILLALWLRRKKH